MTRPQYMDGGWSQQGKFLCHKPSIQVFVTRPGKSQIYEFKGAFSIWRIIIGLECLIINWNMMIEVFLSTPEVVHITVILDLPLCCKYTVSFLSLENIIFWVNKWGLIGEVIFNTKQKRDLDCVRNAYKQQ